MKTHAPASKTQETPATELERSSAALLHSLEDTQHSLSSFYEEMTLSDDPASYEETVETTLHSFRRASGNMLRCSKNMIAMSDELAARFRDLTKSKKRKYRLFRAAPANASIDLKEHRTDHFARGLNLYKMLMLCFIGSFAGVVVEMLWCLLTRGYLESRAGLVFGPFNLLYGVGAVALTACLYPFRNNGKWLSFLGGAVIGSVVEYLCSFLQELVFGSRSWDYSHIPFNLNGRICLLYSMFWGILGVLWVKSLYPRVAEQILRIPERIGKPLTWILTAFFVINAVVTVLAVLRWSQRLDLIAPSNPLWVIIDRWFPNEVMERIFANMQFS